MTYQRLEVITGTARRRSYSDEEKLRLIDEAFRPGVTASEVARRHGINVGLLYRWRRLFSGATQPEPGFLAVTVAPEPESVANLSGLIDIELASGTRIRISGRVEVAVVSAALGALTGSGGGR
jgi:transposase